MPRTKRKYATPAQSAPPTAQPLVQPTPPRFLSPRDAACYVGIVTKSGKPSLVTFWRWSTKRIAEGLLHPDKSTRAWRYDRHELDAAVLALAGKAAA